MEKASITFSILTHDYGYMMCFWGPLIIPVILWHLWYFRSNKKYSGKELEEISPKFAEINTRYTVFSLVWVLGVMIFPFAVFAPRIDEWAVINYGIRFYPLPIILFTEYGIHQGLFAMISGVYPMGRDARYVYDTESRIRRIAIYQISISIALIVSVVLFFFVTV